MRFYPSSPGPRSLRPLLSAGLAVLIIGAGAGSRVNTARADDVFLQEKDTQTEKAEKQAEKAEKQAEKAKADSKAESQDRAKTDAQDEKIRKELDALLRDREKLDERIAATRDRLSNKGRSGNRIFRRGDGGAIIEVKPGQNNWVFADPDVRLKVNEAMKQAQKAMEEARKQNGGRWLVVPPANINPKIVVPRFNFDPGTIVVPKFNLEPGQNRAFRFQWNGKEFDLKDGKQGEIPQETRQRMKELHQRLERMMREIEEQINKTFDSKEAPKPKAPGKEEEKNDTVDEKSVLLGV